jgi:hypothetical protein
VGEGLLGGGDLGSSPVGEGVRSLELLKQKRMLKLQRKKRRLKVVTNDKGEAVGEVLTIIC